MKKGNKNRRKVQKTQNYGSDNQLMSLLKIIVILIVFLGIFYAITLFRTKEKPVEPEVKETEIQYNEILIGSLLKQSRSEYYVLFADLNGADYGQYDSYVSMLEGDSKAIKVYTSDMKSIFNKGYVAEEGNALKYIGKSSIDGITFDKTTLLHVKTTTNKKKVTTTKITDVIVDNDKILSELKSLSKVD